MRLYNVEDTLASEIRKLRMFIWPFGPKDHLVHGKPGEDAEERGKLRNCLANSSDFGQATEAEKQHTQLATQQK